MTLNFWGLSKPLERRLALAANQLRALAPDVVAMQEVRPIDGDGDGDGDGGDTTADLLANALGFQRVYATSLRWADDAFYPGFPAGEEGLAILSRWPIAEHRVLGLPEARPDEARILLSVRLTTPVGPLWCHTTHLHWRLDDGLARERQVVAIDEAVRSIAIEPAGAGGVEPAADRPAVPGAAAVSGGAQSAPSEDARPAPHLLCGDFNATPDADEIRFLRGLTTLSGRRTHYQDAFAHAHPGEPGITWSMRNPFARKLRSLDADRRIDYVFVTSRHRDGRGTVHDARVVLDRVDSDGTCASDHFGVLADVQIEPDR